MVPLNMLISVFVNIKHNISSENYELLWLRKPKIIKQFGIMVRENNQANYGSVINIINFSVEYSNYDNSIKNISLFLTLITLWFKYPFKITTKLIMVL